MECSPPGRKGKHGDYGHLLGKGPCPRLGAAGRKLTDADIKFGYSAECKPAGPSKKQRDGRHKYLDYGHRHHDIGYMFGDSPPKKTELGCPFADSSKKQATAVKHHEFDHKPHDFDRKEHDSGYKPHDYAYKYDLGRKPFDDAHKHDHAKPKPDDCYKQPCITVHSQCEFGRAGDKKRCAFGNKIEKEEPKHGLGGFKLGHWNFKHDEDLENYTYKDDDDKNQDDQGDGEKKPEEGAEKPKDEDTSDIKPRPEKPSMGRMTLNKEEFEARKKYKCYLPKFYETEECQEPVDEDEDYLEEKPEPQQEPQKAAEPPVHRLRACLLQDNQKYALRSAWAMDLERKNGSENRMAFNNIELKMDEAHYLKQKGLQKQVNTLSTFLANIKKILETVTDAIYNLERQRRRLKRANVAYNQCLSIVKGCISFRSQVPPSELVMDSTEISLREEEKLILEKMELFNTTIKEIEELSHENKTAKEKMEEYFTHGYLMYSEKFPDYEQTFRSGPHVVHLNDMNEQLKVQDLGDSMEKTIQASYTLNAELMKKNEALQKKINEMMVKSAEEVRLRADKTEKLLREYITCMQDNIINFERDLENLLKSVVRVDTTINNTGSKVHQYRGAWLNTYKKDIDPEATDICETEVNLNTLTPPPNSTIGLGMVELKNAEDMKKILIMTRFKLEYQLMCKRKALWINSERCAKQHVKFPCAKALNILINE